MPVPVVRKEKVKTIDLETLVTDPLLEEKFPGYVVFAIEDLFLKRGNRRPTVKDLYDLLLASASGYRHADLTRMGFSREDGDLIEIVLGGLQCKPQDVIDEFGESWGTNPVVVEPEVKPEPKKEPPKVVPPAPKRKGFFEQIVDWLQAN